MNYIAAVQGKRWVQYKMYRLVDDMEAEIYLRKKYKDKLVAIYPLVKEL
mgnify:CR=1 FL=1|jgi:hypothetical protein